MKTSVKTSVETPVETLVKTLVKTPVKILMLLRKNPDMTLQEVATNIGRSLSTIKKTAAKLVKEGRLRYIGSQKGGQWEVLESEK